MILVLCSHVFACTRLPDEKLFVRDHFDVIVQDRGQPVVGMEVDVELFDKSSDKWNQVATAITDRVGLASFTGVPKGSYFVGTHTPVKNDGHEIEVTNDPHKLIAQRISLTWPPKKVIVTTKFEGILTSFPEIDVPSESLRDVRLVVLEAHSGRGIGTTSTDAEGRFTLDGVPPGLYFLEVSGEGRERDDTRIWGWKSEGDIAIEYNPFARNGSPSAQLRLLMTDCGLFYK